MVFQAANKRRKPKLSPLHLRRHVGVGKVFLLTNSASCGSGKVFMINAKAGLSFGRVIEMSGIALQMTRLMPQSSHADVSRNVVVPKIIGVKEVAAVRQTQIARWNSEKHSLRSERWHLGFPVAVGLESVAP